MKERLKKKRIGYGDFYCWNCGKRIIKNKRKCPYCNVWYTGQKKYVYPELVKEVNPGIHHRTVRRYRFKELLNFLIWMVGFAVLLPLIIWVGDMGETSFGYIFEEVWLKIVAVMWSFWIIWIVVNSLGRKKKMKKIAELNRTSPEEIKCICCGGSCRRQENYCTYCGTILLK